MNKNTMNPYFFQTLCAQLLHLIATQTHTSRAVLFAYPIKGICEFPWFSAEMNILRGLNGYPVLSRTAILPGVSKPELFDFFGDPVAGGFPLAQWPGTERISMDTGPALSEDSHPSGGSLESGSRGKSQESTRRAQAETPNSREAWKFQDSG